MNKTTQLWTMIALGAAITVGYLIATTEPNTTLLMTGLIGATIFIATKSRPSLLLILFLPLIGELYRLPFGPENGLIITDLIIPIFAAAWSFKKIIEQKDKKNHSILTKPLTIFSVIALLSLCYATTFLPLKEVLSGSTYLIRYISYAILAIIAQEQITQKQEAQKIIHAVIIAGTLIAIGGFIQLVVYPDLKALEEFGWDPHINRLVSTWLDPNFVGGFLAFIIAITTGLILTTKSTFHKTLYTGSILINIIALFLTYSRSAYLALGVVIFIIGFLRSKKLLIGCIIVFAVGITIFPRAAERLEGLTTSVSSLIFQTAENPDPTARLRIKSWEQTLSLIQKRPILGSGYNTLKYVNYQEGFVENTQIHSASGSDSSLLTILATTGFTGLIAFLWLQYTLLKNTWKESKNSSTYTQGLSLGLFAGLCGLIMHSFFVNSLLFAPILIYVWITFGAQQSLTQLSSPKAHSQKTR